MNRDQDTSPEEQVQDDIRRQIRALFRNVKPEHKKIVLKALETYPDNGKKISYLRGWLFIERGSLHVGRTKSPEVPEEPRQRALGRNRRERVEERG